MSLSGKTLFITGATRGIGLAIALRAARDGANVAVLGKTEEPHPALPGTLAEAVAAIERAGGRAIGIRTDIREEEQVDAAVARTVSHFGGIDVVINNASAIFLAGTTATPMKRYDLMHQVNVRGTFMTTQKCIPHLEKAENPHILTLSPPLDLRPEYFAPHVAYTMAKFGMSLCTLGWAEELRDKRIAANCLWPKTIIDTAAIRNLLGGEAARSRARRPEIVADAAHLILCKNSQDFTGNFVIDEELLGSAGVDVSAYDVTPGAVPQVDLFVPTDA